MKKSTGELLELLKKSSDFPSYVSSVSENFIENRSLHVSLQAILKEKHLKKSDIIRRSGLDRKYAYEILSGASKNPARDKVLALCLSMQLSIDEVQKLLNTSEYPILYTKAKRDCIILYALHKHLPVSETNDLLDEMGYEIIE
ncbi:MAG: hypothetical protein NC314_00670 [Roseburia sp.]|nr:hypothetical protein [Roseburia sp.]MCM1241326.1 hypothetical protein [Roseburia sp.]